MVALALPACALAQGSVRGVVRDARGTPQIGALVELVRPDLTVAARTYTDDRGRYVLPDVTPGVYGVKATASMFLPTLRENLHLTGHSSTVLNLTLDTLYQAFRWLPAEPRQPGEPRDDWAWTLRLSANKPLLRMLQNGPLVVVSDGNGQAPVLKARVSVESGDGSFGNGGIHHAFEVERVNAGMQKMILRADLSQSQSPALHAVAGYERQLGLGRTIRSVAAFVDMPGVVGGPQMQGMQAMFFRTAETMELSPALGIEAGGETEIVHMGTTQLAEHPFATVHLRAGNALITYGVSTAPGVQQADMIADPGTMTPEAVERGGELLLEHGLHQEISFAQSSGGLRVRMTVFHDHVVNPVVDGGGTISAADLQGGNLLYDPSTGTIEAAGTDFTGTGFVAQLDDSFPGRIWFALSGGMGDALEMGAVPGNPTVADTLAAMRAQSTAMYSAAVGGSVKRTGTAWRTSYRWQQPGTLTAVDPFDRNLPAPYLSVYLRQPIHCRRVLPNGMEALVDVRNLLAEGYRPFLSRDGSVLYFAQTARAIEGGLSYTF